jgi:hypothetical protein
MKRTIVLAVALFVGLAARTSGKSLETTVTPANLKDQSPGLEVKVGKADGLELISDDHSTPATTIKSPHLEFANDN